MKTTKITPEECDIINEEHSKINLNVHIKSENTGKNPGMKALAKLCLNSLWGKFGQRVCLDEYEFINDYNRLLCKLSNDKINTKTIHIINNNCVELRYNKQFDYEEEPEFGSEITAAFTTSNARIRLISMLHWLDKTQILYCDTDSVFFVYDSNNKNHKYPDNNMKDIPANVKFGESLGCWENEFKDKNEWITDFLCGGAKSYSYKTNKGKIDIKLKSITLDFQNSKIFTFDTIKNTILDKSTLKSEKRYQFTWDNKTKNIETKFIDKTIRDTLDSKRLLTDNYYTLPFGYEE